MPRHSGPEAVPGHACQEGPRGSALLGSCPTTRFNGVCDTRATCEQGRVEGGSATDRSQGHTHKPQPSNPAPPRKQPRGCRRAPASLTRPPWEGGPRGSLASTGSHPSRLEPHPGLGPVLAAATLPPQDSLPRRPSKRNKNTLQDECNLCPPAMAGPRQQVRATSMSLQERSGNHSFQGLHQDS